MRLWPQSLATRVFLLYGLTVVLAAVGGLGLVTHQEFVRHIEESQKGVEKLANLAERTLAESAVIGDFDTTKRNLETLVPNSPLERATYADSAGGVIEVTERTPTGAPDWVTAVIADRLPQMQRSIAMGGRQYGVLTLGFDARQVSAQLWSFIQKTALLTALSLVLGLSLIRLLLRRWLGNLERLQLYEAQVLAGQVDARASLPADAPLEMQQAIEVINRTAGSLRAQFGHRIDVLMQTLIQHKKAMDEATIVCELDREGRISYANESFVRAAGTSRHLLAGRPLAEVGFMTSQDAGTWIPGREIWHGEVQVRRGDGTERHHSRSIVPQFDIDGGIDRYICIDIDITALKKSQDNLQGQVRRQRMLTDLGREALDGLEPGELMQRAVTSAQVGLQASHTALLVQGAEQQRPQLVAGLGWQPHWLGRELAMGEDAPAGAALQVPQVLLELHGIRSHLAVTGEAASGDRFLLAVADTHARDFAPTDHDFLRSIAYVLSAAIDRHHAREHLTRLARFDQLTGLPNRGLLHDRLQMALKSARRQGKGLCLIYIDLDRFKQVNDTLGHEAGDELLLLAAQRMQASVRADDSVARLSGDEFAVLLPQVERPADAEAVARKLLAELSRPFMIQGRDTFISASMGGALHPEDGLDAETLLRRADQAMYHAKRAGRNQFVLFASEMGQRISEQLAYESLLRGALGRNEFFLQYQPKVSLRTGRISGLEALLRWRHPELGEVGPASFVPLLEETGVVLEVGRWVMRTVVEQVQQWRALGLEVPQVAINLSARQFMAGGLAEEVQALLADTGLPASQLEFEITESMLMEDPDQAAAVLGACRAAGLAISVDDFGTGYSSLSYLHRFPLDGVKVDRTFVQDLVSNPENASITWAIINLAHMLKLKVVAEGVETEAQLDLLAAHGCDEIQGYYFSPPVHPTECLRMLRDHVRLQWKRHAPEGTDGAWRTQALATP